MIESDGLPGASAPLQPGWVYINKQTPTNSGTVSENTRIVWKNAPMSNKYPLRTYVDKVLISHTENETQLLKVLLRQTRRPELGDKFSSRHGQKGVCGLIVPQADMPFNDQGICRE
jgi:DNA-directed RNA polymerase III subunit RPC2